MKIFFYLLVSLIVISLVCVSPFLLSIYLIYNLLVHILDISTAPNVYKQLALIQKIREREKKD